MAENKISAVVTNEDHQLIMTSIQAVREKLPFLVDLSPEDRQKVLKLSDKSVGFVNQAAELATQNPDFLPRSFDIDEMKKDVDVYHQLQAYHQALTQVLELVDDTLMQVGSEAYSSALAVYHYAKTSRVPVEGLDNAVDELGKLFARKTKKAE